MTISDYDRVHIEDILYGDGDWFTAQLLRLCAKADSENLTKLSCGFPDVVQAYLDWREGRPA